MYFLTDLILDPLPYQQWRVVEPFIVDGTIAGRIEVPDGFICNLNSIPRPFWSISLPTDYPEAGVVHDWGYRGNLPREVADSVYRDILEHLGMGRTRRNMRYWAVRGFGGMHYGPDADRLQIGP